MQLADAFRSCPRCGAAAERLGRNPFECRRCGFTLYFSPVTAVVCLIDDDAGNVLMLVRAREPARGRLGLPGGVVDPGESAEAAAVREVREEVGLDVTQTIYLGSFPNRYEYRGVVIPTVDLVFECKVSSLGSLKFDPEEVADVRLCVPGPAEFDQMAFESNRLGLELFLKTRQARPKP